MLQREFPIAKGISGIFEDSGCEGGKIQICITDKSFKGMTTIQRHRKIYDLLKREEILYHSISLDLNEE